MQPSLAIDLDGVVVAFFEEVAADYNSLAEVVSGQIPPLKIEDLDYDFSKLDKDVATRMRNIFSMPGFFLKVKPIPGAPAIINQLREIRGCLGIICTAPSRDFNDRVLAHSASEKITWVQQYLPIWGNNVTITQDKFYAGTDMLIDDYPPNIVQWCAKNPKGIGYLIKQPWNQSYRNNLVLGQLAHPKTPINVAAGSLEDIDSFIEQFWCAEEGRFLYRPSELRTWSL